jgi:F-type H+-transporting ATPase subunit b
MHVTMTVLVAAEEHIDRSHSWIWPEGYEAWFGSAASIIIFGLLFWKVGPLVKKAMATRTGRVQSELDDAAAAKATAESEAATIRQALGDIETERQRMLAAADEQAAAILLEGRTRLAREVADIHTKAAGDIESALGRLNDELRAEIARLSSVVAERVVVESLDDTTQQLLVEDFIVQVGSGR